MRKAPIRRKGLWGSCVMIKNHLAFEFTKLGYHSTKYLRDLQAVDAMRGEALATKPGSLVTTSPATPIGGTVPERINSKHIYCIIQSLSNCLLYKEKQLPMVKKYCASSRG